MLNPATLYTVVWSTVLILQRLRLSRILEPLNSSTLIMILTGIATGFLSSVISHFLLVNKKKSLKRKNKPFFFQSYSINKFIDYLAKVLKKLFLFWFVVSLIEIIYCRGIPILWLFNGSGKSYVDFGIASFSIHGLNNSIYMFLCVSCFFIFAITKQRKYLLYFLCLLFWSILIIKRQLFMSIMVECFFIYIVTRKKLLSIKLFLKICCVSIAISWFFGYIGDLRSSFSLLIYEIAKPSESWPFFLPSIYLWFYLYITSPINNIIANIDFINPTYTPARTLNTILPSAITNLFVKSSSHDYNFHLVMSNFNVGTFYQDFLFDFGLIGAIILVFIIQIYSSILFEKMTIFGEQQPWLYLAYAVIFQSLFFSIFANVLLHPAFLFQIVLSFYIGKKFKKSNSAKLSEFNEI